MADVSRQPGVRGTTIAALATNRMIVRDNGDAWDRALDLTGKPARDLSLAEREELLSSVFDADWHDQIFVHARYHERFAKRCAREPFTEQEVRDLQISFRLAWFGKEHEARMKTWSHFQRLAWLRPLVLSALLLIACLPRLANATDPALTRFVDEVLQRNPSLKARILERDSVRREASAAGLLPDPEVAIMVDRVPERMGGEMPMVRYQVSQMLPWPGKLGLMEQALARRADGRAALSKVRALDLERDAKRAYFMLALNAAMRSVNHSSRELLTTIASTALARYGAGVGGHHEVVRAEVERNALDVEAVDLDGERISTVAMMNALRNTDADAPFPDPPLPSADEDVRPPSLAELVKFANAHRPELAAMRAMQREESTMAALARRERLPDLMTSLWYNQNVGGPDSGGLMVGATLPVFNVRRQNRHAEAADLRAASVAGDWQAMRAMIRFEVADALRRFETANRSLDLVVKLAAPRAQDSFASSLAAFSSGSVDMVGVLDAWRALQSVELARVQALIARSASIAEIERAIAGPLPKATP